jgi:hypothetical protein
VQCVPNLAANKEIRMKRFLVGLLIVACLAGGVAVTSHYLGLRNAVWAEPPGQ